MSEFAPGIPKKEDIGDISKVKGIADFVVQKHLADKAGLHYDVRIGTPDSGLISWATRKELPKPGGPPIQLFRQPVHEYSYKDFQGSIPKGTYGAGKVTTALASKALVTSDKPDTLKFTLGDSKHIERFTIHETSKGSWMLRNSTPTTPIPYTKIHYKSVKPTVAEEFLKSLPKGSSVQAKIDGAAALISINNGNLDVASYRTSKGTGAPIIHTERVFSGRPKVEKSIKDTVLRGELYGVNSKTNKVIPPQELGGILNSSLNKSLKTQADKNVELKVMLFDVHKYNGKHLDAGQIPYQERQELLKKILGDLPKQFHLPEEAYTPEEALKMYKNVSKGENALTHEGVVVHSPTGIPTKIKFVEDHDVYIRGFYPGSEGSKYEHGHVGGFTYSDTPTGPILGKVGGGLTDSTRKDMSANPDKYLDRVAKIKAMARLPSGAYREPRFLSLHEDPV